MSPVHSSSTVGIRIHRRRVSPTAVTLFPDCPTDVSPMKVVGNPAPVADQHGDITDRMTTDFPPESEVTNGAQIPVQDMPRNAAVVPQERSNARLGGIARLAACSPPAETRRKS